MIWLTWRQFRVQASVILGAVAAIGIALAVTGPTLFDLYRANANLSLDQIDSKLTYQSVYLVALAAMYAVPVLIGVFWGAPLIAREVEAGTHRLVWTQTVTRNHWLACKLGVTTAIAAVAAGLLSLAVTWWSSPIDRAVGDGRNSGPFNLPRIHPLVFGARGVVPIGYAVFALALGVVVGLVLRRSVPAIAVTLALVVAVQVAVPLLVRPHLVAAQRVVTTISADNLNGITTGNDAPTGATASIRFDVLVGSPHDWMLSNRTINAAGQVTDDLPAWLMDCGPPLPAADQRANPTSGEDCLTRLAAAGYRQQAMLQPAGHYWTLQWRETGLLAVLSLLLVGFSFWRIRRDLT
jgi:hypothetical protein